MKIIGADIGEHMIAETRTELYIFFSAARMSRRSEQLARDCHKAHPILRAN
jgi:hypothetical protein